MSYLAILFLIGAAILVHEFGHYLAAVRVLIPVRVFSVGFGPRIWGFTRGGTEYRLSLIPLGGYVLPDIKNEKDFFRIPIKSRAIMSVAGPAANVILGMACLAVVNSILHGFSAGNIIIRPFVQSVELMCQMAAAIPLIFSHPDRLMGIVGIVSEGGQGGLNLLYALHFLAFISLNLAIVNLLPIPALDGGKLLLYLMEKIHPGLLRLHLPLALAGWVFLLGLMVYVTVMDISRMLL